MAIDENLSSIILLTTLLGIEIGSVNYYANLGIRRNIFGALDKVLVVVDSFNLTSNISPSCEN
jgi:hypothetical protein